MSSAEAPLTLKELLFRTADFLGARGVPLARHDAEALLQHALGVERVQLLLMWERPSTAEEREALRALVRRRAAREPLAWVVGGAGFHALDFLAVPPAVLVPRPDTEALVDAALAQLPNDGSPLYVADIGCGSGAVGLALAHARPGLRLYAVDLSPEALAATKANAQSLGLQARVAVLRGDLLSPIPADRPVDVVVSNPPYIPSAEIPTLQPEVSQWEPRLALDGGPDGLDVYRRLIPAAAARARRAVLVEIGSTQAAEVAALFAAAGLVDVRVHADLAGHPRVVEGRVPARAAAEVEPAPSAELRASVEINPRVGALPRGSIAIDPPTLPEPRDSIETEAPAPPPAAPSSTAAPVDAAVDPLAAWQSGLDTLRAPLFTLAAAAGAPARVAVAQAFLAAGAALWPGAAPLAPGVAPVDALTWLLREAADLSPAELGRARGDGHLGALGACKRVARAREASPGWGEALDALLRGLVAV
jgi:release factor glutamine methyltransferase